jgi:hypothetical protein
MSSLKKSKSNTNTKHEQGQRVSWWSVWNANRRKWPESVGERRKREKCPLPLFFHDCANMCPHTSHPHTSFTQFQPNSLRNYTRRTRCKVVGIEIQHDAKEQGCSAQSTTGTRICLLTTVATTNLQRPDSKFKNSNETPALMIHTFTLFKSSSFSFLISSFIFNNRHLEDSLV